MTEVGIEQETAWIPADIINGESAQKLVVDIDGFEGPLDVLLALARVQKVDLAQISILQLVEQYLEFIDAAQRVELELAADYLVMAAWLAYLKSRLLLPEKEGEAEPSGQEMAAKLAFRLRRLEAMRERGAELMSRHILGRDIFVRGMPEGIRIIRHSKYECSLFELLRAYALQSNQREIQDHLEFKRPFIYNLEEAVRRLSGLIGMAIDWTEIASFLPESARESEAFRSALASTFTAALEITRQGKMELRQMEEFGPIYLKSTDNGREEQS